MKKEVTYSIIALIIGLIIGFLIFGNSWSNVQTQQDSEKTSTFELNNVKFGDYNTESFSLNQYACEEEFRKNNDVASLECYMNYIDDKGFECYNYNDPLTDECKSITCHTDLRVGCVCNYKLK